QRRTSKKESKSGGGDVSKLIFQSFFKPILRFPHQLRAQSKHQNTELHLIQSTVAVEIPFSNHPGDLRFRQVLQAQHGGVQAQALRRNHPSVLVDQQLEPIAELPD
ncbi:hypothetical protein LINGRAHAP2_LOCUS18820, partial [Linum grandiflorum]